MAIKILLVDDEPPILDSLADVLKSAGYEVVCADSGGDGLDKAQDFHPHVLLTDVLMPGMNGFELALQIKGLFPECRLMLFSGQAATAELARNFSQVFTSRGYRFELLPKPIHPKALLERLEKALTAAA